MFGHRFESGRLHFFYICIILNQMFMKMRNFFLLLGGLSLFVAATAFTTSPVQPNPMEED